MHKLNKKIKNRFLFYKQMWGLYTDKGIECNINHEGTTFKIIANSKIELYNRARDYDVEKVTLHWIDKCIKNEDIVYEVGANIGIYSLLIAKKYLKSKIFVFEPEAGNFYKLNKNIRLNNLNNILPFPIGISSTTGISKLYVSSLDLGSSCHSLDEPISEGVKFEHKSEQGIAVYSLQDFINISNLPFPNHLKIDVDGFELNVIKGCGDFLRDQRLRFITIEINDKVSKGEVENLIISHNFEEIMRETWKDGEGKSSNILYKKL